MKRILIAAILLVFIGCKNGGVDLTYKVVTYNSNGSYNSVDIAGYTIFIILMLISYIAGKSNDKYGKMLWKVMFILLILLPFLALLPK